MEPEFKDTPVSSVQEVSEHCLCGNVRIYTIQNPYPWQIVHRVRVGYLSGRTRPSANRIQQLRQLKRLINDNLDDLCQALWHDLHKVFTVKHVHLIVESGAVDCSCGSRL